METQEKKWRRTPACETHDWKGRRCQECGAVIVVPVRNPDGTMRD